MTKISGVSDSTRLANLHPPSNGRLASRHIVSRSATSENQFYNASDFGALKSGKIPVSDGGGGQFIGLDLNTHFPKWNCISRFHIDMNRAAVVQKNEVD